MGVPFAYWIFAGAFALVFLFAIAEYRAVKTHTWTLSDFMAYMMRQSRFAVIFNLLLGMLIGGLLVHFSGWCVGPCLAPTPA